VNIFPLTKTSASLVLTGCSEIEAYLKGAHSSARSNFVHTGKARFRTWYAADGVWSNEESTRRTIKWLLEEDRFTCGREFMEVNLSSRSIESEPTMIRRTNQVVVLPTLLSAY
jgi:hypothetical protein